MCVCVSSYKLLIKDKSTEFCRFYCTFSKHATRQKADFRSLDFVIDRLFMKLFTTNNMDTGTVRHCQHLNFELPNGLCACVCVNQMTFVLDIDVKNFFTFFILVTFFTFLTFFFILSTFLSAP